MSGKPLYNFPAFKEAAWRWRNKGHFVISPHEITDTIWMDKFGRYFDPANDKVEWGDPVVKEMIAADLKAVTECDAVLVLDGWVNSKGATLEVRLAKQCGMPVYWAGVDEHDTTTGRLIDESFIDRATLPYTTASDCWKGLEVRELPTLTLPDEYPFAEPDPIKTIQVSFVLNETVLEEAQRLVYGDRQSAYGHPYDDYSRTAKMWEAIVGQGVSISPRTACLMMAAVKISRECNAHKRDNMTDLAGYAACAQRCAEREQELANGE